MAKTTSTVKHLLNKLNVCARIEEAMFEEEFRTSL